jgi:hypothetical protein
MMLVICYKLSVRYLMKQVAEYACEVQVLQDQDVREIEK